MGLFKKKNIVDWNDINKLKELGMEEYYPYIGSASKTYFVFIDLTDVDISLELIKHGFWEYFFGDIFYRTKRDDARNPTYIIVSPIVVAPSYVRSGSSDLVANMAMERAVKQYGDFIGENYVHDRLGDYTAKDSVSLAKVIYQNWF